MLHHFQASLPIVLADDYVPEEVHQLVPADRRLAGAGFNTLAG